MLQAQQAQDVIGPYRLVRKLGEGAFGEVWLADHPNGTPAQVALKFPKQVDLKAILKEAVVWAKIGDHPNILPILEADMHPTRFGERVLIASPFVAGGSLADWLAEHGGKAPTVEQAVEIISGVLDGLTHLASKNVVHRDLKPANVLMDGMRPMLADFGVARVLGASLQSSVIAGTELYMAPEAFDGHRSHQTDVWSASVLFYKVLTGRLPFPTVKSVIKCKPEPLPATVPDRIRRVLARAFQENPSDRYQTAAELKRDLSEMVPRGRVTLPPLKAQLSRLPIPARSKMRLSIGRFGIVRIILATIGVWAVFGMFTPVEPTMVAPRKIPSSSPPSLKNDLGMEFVLIQPGQFRMGSSSSKDESEKPEHRVTISQAFYMGKCEVTQGQWWEVMEYNRSSFRGDDLPVENVSWEDAQEFIKKLNERNDGNVYSLPTEAEWEYACGHYNKIDEVAWHYGNSGGKTHPVGQKKPNEFGLYDMQGNVFEWCLDWYDEGYYKISPKNDPIGPESGSAKVVRGGWYDIEPKICESYHRVKGSFLLRSLTSVGFRVVVASRTQ